MHPEKRGSFENHRQIFPKLVSCYEAHRQKIVPEELNLKHFRVVWVVETPDEVGTRTRIRNMQECAIEATDGQTPQLFLFASGYELHRCPNILDFEFETAAGELVRLAD